VSLVTCTITLKWLSEDQPTGLLGRLARLASDGRRYYPPVTEPELPEHVARNRVYWDEVNAPPSGDHLGHPRHPRGRASRAPGNLIAGLLAGTLEGRSPSSLFLFVAIFVGAFGVLAMLVRRGVQRLMGGID
jgi:hypothetical protein